MPQRHANARQKPAHAVKWPRTAAKHTTPAKGSSTTTTAAHIRATPRAIQWWKTVWYEVSDSMYMQQQMSLQQQQMLQQQMALQWMAQPQPVPERSGSLR